MTLNQGRFNGASWQWSDHHGWPVLHIRDYQENVATLTPDQLRALLDFLSVRSPEALMKEYQDDYDRMEREADAEDASNGETQ